MFDNDKFHKIEELTGIQLTKTMQEQLRDFVNLFKIYNSHTNLMSKKDEENLFEKHIYDSLSLSLFINKYNIKESIKLLDVGTGGGFPSIPLCILYPKIQIYPLDSIAKKIGFIELVQKELRLENLHPVCKRAEELPCDYKNAFDIVTSRAVSALNILLEYTIPFVKKNSYMIAFKSKNTDEELQAAKNAMKILKCYTADRIKYDLPCKEEYDRELVVIKKSENTPDIYPRQSGLAKKKPL